MRRQPWASERAGSVRAYVSHSCEIAHTTSAPVARVAVTGEIDMACAWEVADVVFDAATRGGVVRVVADLSRVTFMDSTGVSALVAAKQALDANGQELVVSAVPDGVAQILKITGVDEILTVEP